VSFILNTRYSDFQWNP